MANVARRGRVGSSYAGLRPTSASITSGVLIGVNVAVWVAILATGGNASGLLARLELRPNGCLPSSVADDACLQVRPGVVNGDIWMLVTNAFTHVEVFHIALNMLALWVLGPQLEAAVGRSRFLALYLLAALAGSTLVFWASEEYGATVGASGAIFGLMGALLVVAHRLGGSATPILMWIGFNFVVTALNRDTISWQGHVGGFLGGIVVAAILVRAPRGPRRNLTQALGLVGVFLLLVAALLIRTWMLL